MIKLIASDLDGTLLRGGAQELPSGTIDLIRRLTERGIVFVAASGRQYSNERRMFRRIRDEISYIAENGSLCIHRGEVISRGIIPDDLAFRIIEEVRKNPDFELLISREDTCLIEKRDPEFVNHIVNVVHNQTEVVEDIRRIHGPFLKIAICSMKGDQNIIHAYLRHLKDLFGSEIKVVTSGNIWIDFIAPDANKGTALAGLLKRLDISPEECMAFGDQYNDVEMLELAGESYAMKDAAPGMEAHAKHVTESVERVLERLLAEMEP